MALTRWHPIGNGWPQRRSAGERF